jgi:hypothetical protein
MGLAQSAADGALNWGIERTGAAIGQTGIGEAEPATCAGECAVAVQAESSSSQQSRAVTVRRSRVWENRVVMKGLQGFGEG